MTCSIRIANHRLHPVLHKSCQKMPTANQLDRISLGFLDHRYLRNLLHAIPMSSLHLIKLPIIHVTTSSCGQCILKRSYYVKPFFSVLDRPSKNPICLWMADLRTLQIGVKWFLLCFRWKKGLFRCQEKYLEVIHYCTCYTFFRNKR